MWWELTFSVYYGVGYKTCRFRRFADETPASIHSHVGTFLFMYCLFSGVTTGTAISVKEIIPYITVILYSSLCRRYPMITLPGTFSRYSFLLLYGRVTTNPLREHAPASDARAVAHCSMLLSYHWSYRWKWMSSVQNNRWIHISLAVGAYAIPSEKPAYCRRRKYNQLVFFMLPLLLGQCGGGGFHPYRMRI
jgi:hypothetical protein